MTLLVYKDSMEIYIYESNGPCPDQKRRFAVDIIVYRRFFQYPLPKVFDIHRSIGNRALQIRRK